jgi:hypothetical protein
LSGDGHAVPSQPKEVDPMRTLTLLLAAVILSLGLGLHAGIAEAQTYPQTWVSGVGSDQNDCSRTSPCQTFQGALAKTSAGGEISCLDSGPFGGGGAFLQIGKAITISCTGVEGSVLVSTSVGVLITAAATDTVVIEGLDFEGSNNDFYDGILISSAASVTIRNCRIAGFANDQANTGNGIQVRNTGDMELLIVDSVIENNAYAGIYLQPGGSANILATINRVQVNHNTFGIVADGTDTTGKINCTVRDSTVGNNSQNGITASATTASNDTLMLDNVSIIDNSNNGLSASGATAGLLVNNSTIYGNAGGIHTANSASIVSYGNNRLNGNNGNDGAFTSTIALH